MNALFLLAALLFCSTSAFAQSVHGVFRVVKGEVTVTSKAGASTKAKIGQKVFPSDKIKAGADSRAKIVMIDKNEINISPDSEIVIENYQYKPEENKKNVLINVLYGKVRAKVEQKYDAGDNKFQIKTPTAVAGVRGTDFITGFDSGTKTSQVVTFHGKVEFGIPGPNGSISNAVFVSPGQMTTMNGATPPTKPVEVPKSELAGMDKSTDADKASANGGPLAGSPEGKPEKANTKRDPSSSPPTTIKTDDLPASTPPPPPLPPTGGIMQPPPPPPPTDLCPTCKQVIEGQQKLLKIKVTNGTGP